MGRAPGRSVLAVLLLLAPLGCGAPRPPAGALLTWYDQTRAAVAAQGPLPDPVGARTWALAWWAADRATTGLAPGPRADTATATAVHDVLVALAPGRRSALDAALARTTAHGRTGTSVGRAAAAAVLRDRAGDGLDLATVERPVPPPVDPPPGSWRPTPPGFPPPAEAGLASARPFGLRRAAELRPGPPPAPGSPADRRDVDEVQRVGGTTGTERTAAQEALARFWGPSELEVQVRLVRAALVAGSVDVVRGARMLSRLHRVTADAEIAVFDAKYHYLRWRPVTAVRAGAGGRPEPGWTPLLVTPGHPEYPSAHTVYAAAAAAVLTAELGPRPAAPLVVESPGLPGRPRTYTSWEQAVDENEDARVLAGIHYRSSDRAGSALGRSVAGVDLSRFG